MRLIDAEQLLDFVRFDERVIAPEEHTAQDIVMMIQTAPTITLPPNDPLTLEKLREMAGEPVWCEDYQCWGIVKCEAVGNWADKPFLVGAWHDPHYKTAVNFEYDIKGRGLTLYRYKPTKEKCEE